MANEKVWTSEQRVKDVLSDAEEICDLGFYRIFSAAINDEFPGIFDTKEQAWDAAWLSLPGVMKAFESTLRVQDRPPVCAYCGFERESHPLGYCLTFQETLAESSVQDAPEVRKYTCDSCMGEFTTATKYRHPLCPLCHAGQGIDHRENGKQDAPEVVREDAEGKPKCKNCGGEVLNGIVHSDGLAFCTDACETVAEAAKPLSPDRPKGFDFDDVPRWIDGDHSEHVLVVLESDFRRLLSAYRALNTAPRQFSISFEDWWSKQYNSTILTPVIEHNRAKNSAEAAWNAALRTRPEGEAKVTWRVEYEDGFERGYDGEDDARKSYAEADNLQMSSCLIKSETVETVLKTRKRKP